MSLPDDEPVPEAEGGAGAEGAEPGGAESAGAESAGAESAGAESADKALQEALEAMEKYKDLALRAEADKQNMERRTARDMENAHKFALERFMQNLLPVADSLEESH